MSGTVVAADDVRSDGEVVVDAIEAVVPDVLGEAVEVRNSQAPIAAKDGSSVTLSEVATERVEITTPEGLEIAIDLPFAEDADPAELSDGVLVYDNNNGSSTTPLVRGDGSVQILTTIDSADAPMQYAYEVEAGVGGGLVITEDGGVDVIGPDGWVVGRIESPWAVDAHGKEVPTSFRVVGNQLTQVVAHGEEFAYPIVADPKFTQTWWNQTLYFNRKETNQVANYGFGATLIAGWFGLPGRVIAGVLGTYASAFAIYHSNGQCGKLVLYPYPPAPVPQQYGGSEAGGYCR